MVLVLRRFDLQPNIRECNPFVERDHTVLDTCTPQKMVLVCTSHCWLSTTMFKAANPLPV